jgi:CRISPR/Cas system-associated endonuclease Cas3-HD
VNSYLDESHNLIHPFDDEKALEIYQNRFVPLHYHELWASVVSELKEFENTNEERFASMDVQQVKYTTTSNKIEETAILIGTYSSTIRECIF